MLDLVDQFCYDAQDSRFVVYYNLQLIIAAHTGPWNKENFRKFALGTFKLTL